MLVSLGALGSICNIWPLWLNMIGQWVHGWWTPECLVCFLTEPQSNPFNNVIGLMMNVIIDLRKSEQNAWPNQFWETEVQHRYPPCAKYVEGVLSLFSCEVPTGTVVFESSPMCMCSINWIRQRSVLLQCWDNSETLWVLTWQHYLHT